MEAQIRAPLSPRQRAVLLRTAIWTALIVLVLVIYGQTAGFDFVNLDDPKYVYDNPHVQAGLTAGSIKWAFTSQTLGNWIPVTMLSHLATSQFIGMTSGGHHLVNVLLHLISAGLLLLFLERATGEKLASALVAILFAVHPLHVESVAWVTERKDVLSALFLFLALLGYLRYAARPGLGRYLLVLVPFGLGLLSKPMLVTFPFLLILLDFWPLRRPLGWRLVGEKVPLVLLSAGEAAGTYWIQKAMGSVQTLPASTRISNAFTGYILYIGQTFRPSGLAVFYPYPPAIPAWKAWSAAVILLIISGFVIYAGRTRRWLAVGWLWYLGILVPVVGFVQTGYQAHADRYAYLPLVGIFIMLAWGGVDVCRKWPRMMPLVSTVAGLSILLCTALAWRQAEYWENNEKLYLHALEVTEDNWLAHGNLGTYLRHFPERRGEAIGHLEAALRLRPDYPEAHNNLGVCLAEAGLCDSAIPHFEEALRQTPNEVGANTNLGICLLKTGRYAEAVGHFQTVLKREPDLVKARLNLGIALAKIPGREEEALRELEAVLKSEPKLAEAAEIHHTLGVVLMNLGRPEEAKPHLEAAEGIQPVAKQ